MNAKIYSHDYLICPHCDEKSGERIDHLYADAPSNFGPWNCEECGESFEGLVESAGAVIVKKSEKATKRHPGLSLLKIDGKDGPIFFVMRSSTWEDAARPETPEKIQESKRFLFEEHSCPTNWIRDCARVIENGDTDPHGVMEFVRHVTVPADFDEYNVDWSQIFPEAFGILDLEANKATNALADGGK